MIADALHRLRDSWIAQADEAQTIVAKCELDSCDLSRNQGYDEAFRRCAADLDAALAALQGVQEPPRRIDPLSGATEADPLSRAPHPERTEPVTSVLRCDSSQGLHVYVDGYAVCQCGIQHRRIVSAAEVRAPQEPPACPVIWTVQELWEALQRAQIPPSVRFIEYTEAQEARPAPPLDLTTVLDGLQGLADSWRSRHDYLPMAIEQLEGFIGICRAAASLPDPPAAVPQP